MTIIIKSALLFRLIGSKLITLTVRLSWKHKCLAFCKDVTLNKL